MSVNIEGTMTPVKVWQERVKIRPMKPGRRIYILCSWKIAFIGIVRRGLSLRRDRYAERAENLKSWQAVWLENDYIKVMILRSWAVGCIARGIK